MLEVDPARARPDPLGESPSADGYIRLTPSRLRALSFDHLLSGLDLDPLDAPMGDGATVAAIAGFTEWASVTAPALSLGWDWVAEVDGRELRYRRVGEPRSNIMLVNHESRDLGPEQNALALGLAVDEWHWQDAVASTVRERYS